MNYLSVVRTTAFTRAQATVKLRLDEENDHHHNNNHNTQTHHDGQNRRRPDVALVRADRPPGGPRRPQARAEPHGTDEAELKK